MIVLIPGGLIIVKKVKTDYSGEVNKESSTGLDPRIANLIAYLFSWPGGLAIWLLEKGNRFVKWNAMQALILGIVQFGSVILISVILGLIPYIGWYFFSWFGYVLAGIAVVLAIVAIIMGFSGKTFRIPIISKLADKYFLK